MTNPLTKKLLGAAVAIAVPGALLSSLLVGACTTESSCFVTGTLVSTPDGPRAIESLKVGDLVWSYSFAERCPVARALIAVHRALVREARRVDLDDGRAIRGVTPSHPVFSPKTGLYSPVALLTEGESVATYREGAEPSHATVSRIVATEVSVPSIEVFNLSVAGADQNYFADGVLVHNKSPVSRSCSAEGVRAELVAVDASTQRYAVRVTFAPPSGDVTQITNVRFFVGEGGADLCDAPVIATPNSWTCALKPLADGRHALTVLGSATLGGRFCEFELPLAVTLGDADGGTPDASADAAREPDAAAAREADASND